MRTPTILLGHAVDMYADVKEQAFARVQACGYANEERAAIDMGERITAAAATEVLARTLAVAEAAGRLRKPLTAALDDLERGAFTLDPGPEAPTRPSNDGSGVEIDRALLARHQSIWLANLVASFMASEREAALTEALDVLGRAMPDTVEPPRSMLDDAPAI